VIVLIELLLGADLASNINVDKELQCTLSYAVVAVKMLMALPVTYSIPSIARVRIVVGCGGCDQPRDLSPGPHLPFITLHDRGPPTRSRLRRGLTDRWIESDGINPNILSLDLILYFNFRLKLYTYFFYHSITDQCIECASSSWSVAIRLNSYNTHLCFETDS
jgi:hypothetical protein